MPESVFFTVVIIMFFLFLNFCISQRGCQLLFEFAEMEGHSGADLLCPALGHLFDPFSYANMGQEETHSSGIRV